MKRDASRIIAAAAVLLVLAACSQSPTIKPTPTQSSTPTASQTQSALALYYVADTSQGLRLYREFHRTAIQGSPMETALKILLSGENPQDPDYTNLWPRGSVLNGVTIAGNTATIDLTFPALNVGSEAEMRAIDQLVWTATAAAPSITKIRLLRDGASVETFAGHVDTRGEFKREASYEVLAPVWITSAEEGQTVQQPLTLGGLAQVFEANVQWQVLKGKQVVAEGSTLATEAAPARAPWEVKVTNLPAGTYTIRAFASSAKDGSLVAEDTKEVKLR